MKMNSILEQLNIKATKLTGINNTELSNPKVKHIDPIDIINNKKIFFFIKSNLIFIIMIGTMIIITANV